MATRTWILAELYILSVSDIVVATFSNVHVFHTKVSSVWLISLHTNWPKELRVERPFVHQSFFLTVCNSIQFWTPIWYQKHSHQEVPRVHLSSWGGVMRPQHHMIVSTVYFFLISRYLNRNQCRSTAVFRRSTTKFHICCFNIILHEPAQSYTSMKSHLASQPQLALLCSQRTYKHRSRGLIIN